MQWYVGFSWVPGSSGVIARVGGVATRGWAYVFQAEFFAAAQGLTSGGFFLVAGGRALARFAGVVGVLAEAVRPAVKHVGGFDDNVGRGASRGSRWGGIGNASCEGRIGDGGGSVGGMEPSSLCG